ncbi:MAG: PaaX family transcriptional regulator C-terminal domain-containing protein, partial [Gemmatimonadota bacterium]
DPELPKELLPNEWPGEECRELAASLYTQLLPAATRYAERLLQNVTAVPLSTSHS